MKSLACRGFPRRGASAGLAGLSRRLGTWTNRLAPGPASLRTVLPFPGEWREKAGDSFQIPAGFSQPQQAFVQHLLGGQEHPQLAAVVVQRPLQPHGVGLPQGGVGGQLMEAPRVKAPAAMITSQS